MVPSPRIISRLVFKRTYIILSPRNLRFESLSVLNIRKAPDLIFVPPAKLLWKLPAGSITFPGLKNYIVHIRNAFVGLVLTGDQLSGGLEVHIQLLSVHSRLPALDELVGNKFGDASGGCIIEISGAGAARKTERYPWSSVKMITLR